MWSLHLPLQHPPLSLSPKHMWVCDLCKCVCTGNTWHASLKLVSWLIARVWLRDSCWQLMAALSIEINPHKTHAHTCMREKKLEKIRNFANLLSCPTFATPISPLEGGGSESGRKISHGRPKALSILEPFYSSFTGCLRLISHGFSISLAFSDPQPPSSVFQVEISTIPGQLMARMRPFYQFDWFACSTVFLLPRFLWVVCQIGIWDVYNEAGKGMANIIFLEKWVT